MLPRTKEKTNDGPKTDADVPASGNEQSFGFQCSKCGTERTYMERGTLEVTVDQAAEWMGMMMVNGYPQCSDGCPSEAPVHEAATRLAEMALEIASFNDVEPTDALTYLRSVLIDDEAQSG